MCVYRDMYVIFYDFYGFDVKGFVLFLFRENGKIILIEFFCFFLIKEVIIIFILLKISLN